MKLDVKINKKGEKKINEFSAEKYLEKLEIKKSDEADSENADIMPRIPKCARYILIAIVVYNSVGDIIHAFCCSFKISTQTNVLAILLVILLIIDGLLTRRNKKATRKNKKTDPTQPEETE